MDGPAKQMPNLATLPNAQMYTLLTLLPAANGCILGFANFCFSITQNSANMWIVTVISLILFSYSCGLEKGDGRIVSNDLANALELAIEYFNRSVNLVHNLELVEQFYELERDEGSFLPAKLMAAPDEMKVLRAHLEKIEYQVQNNYRLDDEEIATQLRSIEYHLEANFGARGKNFRTHQGSPLSDNLWAMQRMEAHLKGLMMEYKDYSKVQLKVFKTYHIITESGVILFPEGEESTFFLLQTNDDIDELELPKAEGYTSDYLDDIVNSVKEKLSTTNLPQQTTQEIQALQNILLGLPIGPSEKDMLQGFLPELNKQAFCILTKLKELEGLIDKISEEGRIYTVYMVGRRESLYELLHSLKRKFNMVHDEL